MGKGDVFDTEGDLLSPYAQVVQNQAFANPLVFGASSGYGPYAQTDYGVPQAPDEQNPLVRPPVPVREMPIEQQVAWEKYQRDGLAAQAEQRARLFSEKVNRRNEQYKVNTLDQADRFIEEMGDLDPRHPDYQLQKTQLQRKYPLALQNPAVADNIKSLDDTYTHLRGLDEEEQKYQRNKADTTLKERINQGYQLAQKAGPEVLAQFNQDVTADPERAIQSVADLTARSEQENTIADLTSLGLDPKQFYGPSGQFLSGHAKQAINLETKRQTGATAEVKRQIDIMDAMSKVRDKAQKHDQDLLSDALVSNPKMTEEEKKALPLEWPEEREAAYNQVISRAGAALLPQKQPGQPQPQQQQVTQPQPTGQPQPSGTPRPQQVTTQRPVVKRPPAAPGATPTAVEATATGPNGEKMVKRGGKWYAM